MADNETAVPKFGEWDDGDAKAPENYTAIFNKVREERQDQTVRGTPTRLIDSTNSQNHEQNQKLGQKIRWSRYCLEMDFYDRVAGELENIDEYSGYEGTYHKRLSS
uniref:RIN4 pathogenic type III effector avirulence factor Avr cleavage site domain-containing protein n=1 Tax=Cucumis sativus TaxID=3659 RepID=A0A0A0L950_CUCSA